MRNSIAVLGASGAAATIAIFTSLLPATTDTVLAANRATNDTIVGCWNQKTGNMKIKAFGAVGTAKCPNGTTMLSWGTTGPAGPEGPQGPSGARGVTGLPGLDGLDGLNGTDGIDGARGPAGTAGQTGATGPAGPAGSQGATGQTGAAGAKGETGAAGAQGIQGPAGADGKDGTDGKNGLSVVRSSESISGLVVPAGKYSVTANFSLRYTLSQEYSSQGLYLCKLVDTNTPTSLSGQHRVVVGIPYYSGGNNYYAGNGGITIAINVASSTNIDVECTNDQSPNSPPTIAPLDQSITAISVDTINPN